MKKLHKLQIISKLVVTKLLRIIALFMRNFIANLVRILGICKNFAGNRVNVPWNFISPIFVNFCYLEKDY